jgi:hypothetical protein
MHPMQLRCILSEDAEPRDATAAISARKAHQFQASLVELAMLAAVAAMHTTAMSSDSRHCRLHTQAAITVNYAL